MELFNNFNLDIELRKSSQKTVLNICEKDLKENQDKVLSTIQKECVDLKSWFYIILYYYSREDYNSFEKFSKELSKIDIEQNPFYKDQKILFINIINIISLFYSFIAYRTKDKENFDLYSKLSNSLINKADSLQNYHHTTIIINAFFSFIQGDYENSERNFLYYSDNSIDINKKVPTNIVILSKLGRALIAYNQSKYDKAIQFFASLIREYNYINENILESLGICYYKGNKIKKAKEIFEATLTQYPNNYKIKTYLALIKLSYLNDEDNHNFNEAFEELMIAYKMNNFNDNTIPALLVNLCNIFLISGKFEEAGILCQKLNNQLEYAEIKFNKESKNSENISQNNNNIKGYNELKSAIFVINAKYLLSIDKTEEAFIYFMRSVQENTKNIEAQFGLGRIYLLTQNFSEAENCFMECKNILDENKWVSFKILKYLGFVLSITKYKEIEKSIDLFKKAIELKKDDIDCYIKLGELLNLREPDKSLKYYMKALELIKMKKKEGKKNENSHHDEPSIYSIDILPELLNNIGCTLLVKEEYADVEKYLNEAKDIIKEEFKKLKNKNKGSDMDKDDKKKLIRLKSLTISVDFNLALYYDSQALFDYSHFLYKKIISENPYFIEAYIKLSELYRMRGNKIKTEFYIKLAIEKHFKIIQEERKDKNDKNDKEENKDKDKDKQNIDSDKDKMDIEESEKKNNNLESLNKNLEKTSEILPKKSETKSETRKTHKLISVMNKPINPMIMQAYYFYENGKSYDAISILNKILNEYAPHDPYTLIFIANIYYSMSVDNRSKSIDKEKMKKAIELYFRALEYDKYNALAAVGLSNCLCEFNYVDKAIDIYRAIMEKFPNEYNALINSSLIYMDDKKYEKAAILLHKVLVINFHGNNAKIENLLAKCCIRMKEFKSANQYIKNLIMKYPDNPIYQYNYGFLLFSQFDDIINQSTRKYSDTEKAIKLISKALKIFEELNSRKKEEIFEKYIQKTEFLYKCSDMKNICSINLTKAKDILKEDLENEEILKKKNEEELNEYKKKLELQKEQKEKEEKMKIKEPNEQDEEILKENLELMNLVEQKNKELLLKQKEKGKKEKKGKRKGKNKEELEIEEESFNRNRDMKLNEENEEKEYESEEDKAINSDYYDEEEENRKKKKKEEKAKKKFLLKKRKFSSDNEDENNENKSKEKDENIENEENENAENAQKENSENARNDEGDNDKDDNNNENENKNENSENVHENNEEISRKEEEENDKENNNEHEDQKNDKNEEEDNKNINNKNEIEDKE